MQRRVRVAALEVRAPAANQLPEQLPEQVERRAHPGTAVLQAQGARLGQGRAPDEHAAQERQAPEDEAQGNY